MEGHLKALGIKFIIVATIIMSLFGIFYQLTFTNLLMLSLLITGLSYGVGDLIVYPRLGNLWATVIDGLFYFGTILLLSFVMIGISFPITITVLAATYFLTIAEPLFHTYMKERVYRIEDDDLRTGFPIGDFQMEASEEISEQQVDRDETGEPKD